MTAVYILAAPVFLGLVVLLLWPTISSWQARRNRRRRNRYWK